MAAATSVTDAVLKLFADLATPTIANALGDVGFDGVLSGIGRIVGGPTFKRI